jgi:radial spoke head protein 9
MVQLQPNLALTLKHLGTCGAVISSEQQAALDHSLPIKRIEAGLKSLILWGKITTLNGKDYLIAEGSNDPTAKGVTVNLDAKYYYSQDCIKWLDLQPIDMETADRAARIRTQLSGDASKVYPLEEKDPNAPPPAEGEEAEPPKPLVFEISELQLLKFELDSINTSCGIIPTGSTLVDAQNRLVINKLFGGSSFPEKLESYMHRVTVPGGPTLAEDLRGSWSVQYDQFKGIAICKCLIWPGYYFYFNIHELTWGSLYVGDGQRNNDLIFML